MASSEVEIIEIPERSHAEGCPMDPARVDRVEAPAKTGPYAGQKVEIFRCLDCGGELVRPLNKE